MLHSQGKILTDVHRFPKDLVSVWTIKTESQLKSRIFFPNDLLSLKPMPKEQSSCSGVHS